jgi:type IV pilus assembly protein PilA
MKKTNKGFSLVELIIVIAIMAILIGVLAPQYIKYVEKSRVSADEDAADALKNAVMTATTDEEYIYSIADNAQVKLNQNNISIVTGTDTNGGLAKALNEYFAKWDSTKLKSKKYKGSHYLVSVYPENDALKVVGLWQNGD